MKDRFGCSFSLPSLSPAFRVNESPAKQGAKSSGGEGKALASPVAAAAAAAAVVGDPSAATQRQAWQQEQQHLKEGDSQSQSTAATVGLSMNRQSFSLFPSVFPFRDDDDCDFENRIFHPILTVH